MASGLAAGGWRVVGMYHRPPPDGGPEVPGVDVVLGDITVEADCARAVAETRRLHGALDILVNNAAISHQPFPRRHDTDIGDIDPEVWRRVVDVNVFGTFLMTRAALPALLEGGWGRIVNITTSKETMLRPTYLPYSASKSAVEAMTVNWAEKLRGTGVTVNALHPGGPTDTPAQGSRDRTHMWPAEMMVPPLLWLASPASDGVTGRRFAARMWDPSLPEGAAASIAGFPAGWPIEPHDLPYDRRGLQWPPR